MVQNPRPTRAEMTDVANAIFESADAIMLGDETANGQFVVEAVEMMASIARNAEEATNYYALHCFTRDFSSKPFTTLEAVGSCLARTAADATISAVLTCTENGDAAEIVCKFRPQVPHIVLTSKPQLAAAYSLYFGMVGVHIAPGSLCIPLKDATLNLEDTLKFALDQAKHRGAYTSGKVAILHGATTLSADEDGVLSVLDPQLL
jgi:pyruvate kinase